MKRKPVLLLVLPLLIAAFAVAAFAGGWAVVTLSEFPDYAVAGKPLVLSFAVRQHGQTLLSGLKPAVLAVARSGVSTKAAAVPGRGTGEYSASLTLPEPGEWSITIDSGFNGNSITLPRLKVIAAALAEPEPFAASTRGMRLFAAKGCVGCHTHVEVNPERKTDATFNLTGKRFQEDYLKKFLADPGIKTADMPNLHLKSGEIDALVAFINRGIQKKEGLQR